MRTRLRGWLWQWLIAVDQLAHVWCAGWLYVWLGRGECPSADETISSRVGRSAVAGAGWALKAERVIDWLAEQLGDAPGHCRRHIEKQFDGNI